MNHMCLPSKQFAEAALDSILEIRNYLFSKGWVISADKGRTMGHEWLNSEVDTICKPLNMDEAFDLQQQRDYENYLRATEYLQR